MPSIISLISKLRTDFPEISFVEGIDFHWSPEEKIVYYPSNSNDTASLLHELAHATLNHVNYSRDIQLIELERDAWSMANLHYAQRYDVKITEDEIENALDSYRDWLHARSTCPNCSAVGIQTALKLYRCLVCHTNWQVNEARTCALRRYKVRT